MDQARAYLDDGTAEGRRLTEEAVMKAMGAPFDVTGLPADLSRAAVGRIVADKVGLKAVGHNLYVRYHRMAKQRGVKSWRVLVSPEADLQPSQFTYRGHLVNVNPAPPPKPRPVVVRAPKRKPRSKKGTSKDPPPEPKWIPGWKDAKDANLPAWAKKSYAQVAAAKAGTAEAEPEESEEEEEEAGNAPPSPDKAAGRPLPKAAARGPSRPAAEADQPAMAQFAALLPGLMQMLTAFQEGKLTAGARPLAVDLTIPGGEEKQPGNGKDKVAAGGGAGKEDGGLPDGHGPAPLPAAKSPGPY
jgi:hypothetical protein